MAIASNFPAIRPSLNLDFANARALDPRITFSRASAATYYDGKTVAKAEENLLKNSDGPPSVNSGVVNNGDGTFSISAATQWLLKTLSTDTAVGVQFTVSCELSGSGTVRLSGLSGQGGAIGSDTLVTLSETPIRYTWTGVNTAAGVNCGPVVRGAADGSSATVRPAKWQMELRSQATAYTPTTGQSITNYVPVLQTAPAGVPRFDHNPVTGESLGLLVEEQRTNLLTYSEQFADASWLKTGSSISANTVIAPDGTLTADTIVATDTNTYLYRSNLLTSGVTYTLSMCLKAGSSSTGGLYASGVACVAIFNLAAGTVTSVTNGAATITPIGNSFYRCSITFTAATGSNVGYFVAGTSVGSSVHAWGAQLEAGAFPTSYIKTEASQVTRAADSASMTGTNFSSWYRQDEGTLVGDAFCGKGSSDLQVLVTLSDNSFSNCIYPIIRNQINVYRALSVRSNGVEVAALEPSAVPFGNVKVAAAFMANSFSGVLNGGSVSTDNSGTLPVVDRLHIGRLLSFNHWSGHIRRITYYPKRLSDAQLQALTA